MSAAAKPRIHPKPRRVQVRVTLHLVCEIDADSLDESLIRKVSASGVDITDIVKNDQQPDAWVAAEVAAIEVLHGGGSRS